MKLSQILHFYIITINLDYVLGKNKYISPIMSYKKKVLFFAFWLDNQILLKSNYTKSLDDVMKTILKICKTERKSFSEELFIDVLDDYLDLDMVYLLQKHNIKGEDLDLVNAKWIDGFKFELENSVPVLKISNPENINYIID